MNKFEIVYQKEQELTAQNKYDICALEPFAKEQGYESGLEYLRDKRDYLLSQWIPKVFRPTLDELAEVCATSIKNEECKIIIPYEEGLHVWEGDQKVDYELCEELGVQVVNASVGGGTFVGSDKDFTMMVVMPRSIGFEYLDILNKLAELISKSVEGIEVNGNDLLLDGKKVCGTTWNTTENTCIFTCQVTFEDYTEYIEKLCTKKSNKTPSYINNSLLTRDQLEKEILNWLVNKN